MCSFSSFLITGNIFGKYMNKKIHICRGYKRAMVAQIKLAVEASFSMIKVTHIITGPYTGSAAGRW